MLNNDSCITEISDLREAIVDFSRMLDDIRKLSTSFDHEYNIRVLRSMYSYYNLKGHNLSLAFNEVSQLVDSLNMALAEYEATAEDESEDDDSIDEEFVNFPTDPSRL